jgi:hypothetical protein
VPNKSSFLGAGSLTGFTLGLPPTRFKKEFSAPAVTGNNEWDVREQKFLALARAR